MIEVAFTADTFNSPVHCISYSIPGTSASGNNQICGSGSTGNITLPSSGAYMIMINPGSASGGVTVSLTGTITEPITFGTPLAVSSSVAGQIYELTFNGTAEIGRASCRARD